MNNQASNIEAIFSAKQAQKRRRLDFVPSKQSTPFQVSKPAASQARKVDVPSSSTEPFKPRSRNYDVAASEKNPNNPLEYLDWLASKKIGPGFYNEGNSCYLNSTLQCLMYLPPLVQLLLKENVLQLTSSTAPVHASKPSHASPTPTNTPPRLVVELFRALVKEVHCPSPPKTLSPRGMVASIRRVGRQFRPLRQEDAHEYLRQLIDCMHEEIIKHSRKKASDAAADKAQDKNSLIQQIFGGALCNMLACNKCGYISKTYNSFQDLSLEIGGGISSLSQALAAFTKGEVLSKGNEWTCGGCKKKVQALKQMTICSPPPPVLVLHLKRFGGMGGMGWGAKNNKQVAFPPTLTLPPASLSPSPGTSSSSSSSCPPYSLQGVVVHHGGGAHSGHYIAYVKGSGGGWYEMNDTIVSPVPPQRVLGAQAYILFYVMKPTAPTAASTVPVASAQTSAPAAPMQSAKSAQSHAIIEEIFRGAKKLETDSKKTEERGGDDMGTETDDKGGADDAKGYSKAEPDGLDDYDEEGAAESGSDSRQYAVIRFRGPILRLGRWKTGLPPLRAHPPVVQLTGLRAPLRKRRRGDDGDSDSDDNSEDNDDSNARDSDSDSRSESSDDSKTSDDDSDSSRSDEPDSSPAPVVPSAAAAPPSALTALLSLSQRGRQVGGEGGWGQGLDVQSSSAVSLTLQQQEQTERREKKARRIGGWDALLDQGRVKKVRRKEEEGQEEKGGNVAADRGQERAMVGGNIFQQFAEQKTQARDQGSNADERSHGNHSRESAPSGGDTSSGRGFGGHGGDGNGARGGGRGFGRGGDRGGGRGGDRSSGRGFGGRGGDRYGGRGDGRGFGGRGGDWGGGRGFGGRGEDRNDDRGGGRGFGGRGGDRGEGRGWGGGGRGMGRGRGGGRGRDGGRGWGVGRGRGGGGWEGGRGRGRGEGFGG